MRVLVLIPTYNERDNVERAVFGVLQHAGFGAIVLDDASPDGTGQIAAELAARFPDRVQYVPRPRKEGLGRAYLHGMAIALTHQPDLICQMDADGSHDPADLPRLAAAAAAGSQLVIGSRYVSGGRLVNWPGRRKALSWFGNAYARIAMGLRVRDCTAGYRCWRPEAVRHLLSAELRSDGYAFQLETLYEATSQGGRVSELPITFTERRHGVSKMSSLVILEAMTLPWRIRARVRHRIRRMDMATHAARDRL